MPRRGSVPPTTEPTVVEQLVMAIESRTQHNGGQPLLVGLDGRSGTGKSTLADAVATALRSVAVIKGDEFYAGGAQEEWDDRTADEKSSLVIDWRRQLAVIETLGRSDVARWHGYDWEAFDGSLVADATETLPADVVILEGAYSCRPELAKRLDLTVLLRLENDARLERLLQRDGLAYRDDWLARWTEAEDHYFSAVRPPESFDLVLSSSG